MSSKHAHDLKCRVAESEPTVERLRDWVHELAEIVERLAGAVEYLLSDNNK